MRCRSPFASGLTFLLLAAALPPASAAPASRDPVDWVNPFIGTATARWFFFSSACRPFGMVNLSPDTRTDGDWMNGYLHGDSVIRCLSHVHCWQLSGIPVMPTTGPMQGHLGMDAYQSPFSHDDEEATPGYHRVVLQRYGITAEMTSTPRVGLHRFTFPADTNSAVLFDLGATLGPSAVSRAHARRTGERALEGWSVLAPTSRRPKPVTVYFVAEFDRPMTRFGVWKDRTLIPADSVEGPGSGAWAGFITAAGDRVHMKVALSYTSLDNARRNLAAELPGWDFDGVRRASRDEWNAWLSRLDIEGGTPAQRTRFYTDLWHALLGRRTVSDVGGSYYDATGDTPRVRTVTPGPRGETFPHYNFDAHWGAQWTLSPLWSLAYPEVLDGFCATMVDMYRNGGLIPRGPAGGITRL